MLRLFALVLFSSIAVGIASLLYILAERFFQKHLNLRVKALTLKLIIFLQPALILLTVVALVWGFGMQEKQEFSLTPMPVPSTTSSQPPISTNISPDPEPEVFDIRRVKSIDLAELMPFVNCVAYAWFVVVLVLLAWKTIAYVKFINLIKKNGLHALDYAETKLDIYQNKAIGSPFLVGFFKPFIVVPDAGADEFELSLIVKHETVHFENRDIQLKFALELLKCINWFNPIICAVQKRFNHVAELLADETVSEDLSFAQRKEYGQMLLRFSEDNTKCPKFCSSLGEEAKNLAGRLELLMNENKNKKMNKFSVAFIIAIAALLLTAGVYVNSIVHANAKSLESVVYNKLDKPVGKLIYDDGIVQIFDGFADESIPAGLAQIDEPETADTEFQPTVSAFEVIRETVLEEGIYRCDANLGDHVYSLTDGKVISAEYEPAYGYSVTIEDEEGLIWKYAHCNEFAVNIGDHVSSGDLIAYAGITGNTERYCILIKLMGK